MKVDVVGFLKGRFKAVLDFLNKYTHIRNVVVGVIAILILSFLIKTKLIWLVILIVLVSLVLWAIGYAVTCATDALKEAWNDFQEYRKTGRKKSRSQW